MKACMNPAASGLMLVADRIPRDSVRKIKPVNLLILSLKDAGKESFFLYVLCQRQKSVFQSQTFLKSLKGTAV